MSLLTIYVPQDGDFFKESLDAVVTLMASNTYQTAIDIVSILVIVMVGYQYIVGDKLKVISKYILTSFFVTICLINTKVNVAIIDMQMSEGAGKALTVDNVPLGIALPASIISGLGYGVTYGFSSVFHMPDDMDYNKTGMIFGSRTWLASTVANLTASPELSLDLSSYLRQCVFSAKLLGSHTITPDELVNSNQLNALFFHSPSPIYRVIFHDGQNLGCKEASIDIKKRLPIAVQTELSRLNKLMVKNNSDSLNDNKYSNVLQSAHQYFIGISKTSAEILTQNILINATRDAAKDAFSFVGADAALMNYTNTTSMQKMHIAEANSFWLSSYRLPYYMSVMWMLTICIFPLVVLVSFFPIHQNIYFIYLQSQIYLWSWPPMFIIIHFFVSLASHSAISIFGTDAGGGGVSFSNIDSISSIHSNFAYTASALASIVPVLSYFITKGLGAVMSNASQLLGGAVQSASASESQSVSQGNISMANYSGWNMNANKFDTNRYHAEGRSTTQMDNGALLSTNADGSHTGNIQPAISSAAVSVHGSDRVIDSLNKSASESFSHANQLRTTADEHMQAGLNQFNQFNEQDSNDFRSGTGVSNSVNDSINKDLRIMKDAISHNNTHHDKTYYKGAEANIHERFDSSKQFFGKIFQYGTGASINGSVGAKAGFTINNSQQSFDNTSDGQAFSNAYNHMINTAKSHHLDVNDSHNLSKSEQIAANFAKGEALMAQSSTEYMHGQQLQNAATHAKEHATAIDSNLNQAYHDFVVSRYGSEGEAVMLKADTESILKQTQWADEFLNSGEGINAISAQVNSALSTTGDNLKQRYHDNATQIKNTSAIKDHYQTYGELVDAKGDKEGVTSMNENQLQQANVLKQRQQFSNIDKRATDTIKKVNQTLDNSKLNNNKE